MSLINDLIELMKLEITLIIDFLLDFEILLHLFYRHIRPYTYLLIDF